MTVEFRAQEILEKILAERVPVGDEFTEDALALRFSERHENDLRYVALQDQWYRWDGVCWVPENTLLVFDLIRDGCRSDAKNYTGNQNVPKGIYAAKTVAAVERFARADRRQAATIEQWDADNWQLGTTNQIIDLRTGIGLACKPEAYITKKTQCEAASVIATLKHPIWSAFLDRITNGDISLQQFLQRYIGYCLTGDTSEHKFVFAYGTGANGKSTFINTIAAILGEYATIADVSTFIASHHERHPTDLAKLHGHRLVIAQETESGRRWDAAKIKSMTGGDKMTARFMRCDFFDYLPKFKLFITGNHKPRLESVDEAMRRRMLLVPFTVQIPVEERDPQLAEKLKAEYPAILRWCIDGCLEWQEKGLRPPAIVSEATDAYFEDQDVIGQWLDECIKDAGPFAFTPSTQLYASWKGWCDRRGVNPGSMRELSDRLLDRGHHPARRTSGRGFKKLVVKDDPVSLG